jgi:predicted acetyltransferase
MAAASSDMGSALRIEPVARAHADALVEMAREFLASGDPRLRALLDDAPGWFEGVERDAAGLDLPAGRVPQTHYLLLRGEQLLGGARLRWRLSPVLHRDGGNVGYEIRPTQRGRGHATALLGLVAGEARRRGMERLLVTTARTNLASIRVIEKNGGAPGGAAISPHTGEEMLRYWIRL